MCSFCTLKTNHYHVLVDTPDLTNSLEKSKFKKSYTVPCLYTIFQILLSRSNILELNGEIFKNLASIAQRIFLPNTAKKWCQDNLFHSILTNAILANAIIPNLTFCLMPFYPTPTLFFPIVQNYRNNYIAMDKIALSKMKGLVNRHWIKWNSLVNCHVTL